MVAEDQRSEVSGLALAGEASLGSQRSGAAEKGKTTGTYHLETCKE